MSVKCPKCHTENPDTAHFCSHCATSLHSSQEILHTQTLETAKEELTTGSTFAGRYQIIEELGKGGMGRVYKAIDKKIKEKIALKLIKPEIASDKKTIERFSNELKFARKIRHKNVCQMFDLNAYQGIHFITMEYIVGEDLKRLIRKMNGLSAGQSIAIAKQLCGGLIEAHKLGVVHRDLKPQNIMIDEEGNVRIMDFGIARSLSGKGITGPDVMVGTPEYMSPEQVEGKETDQRSDIYSLGIILYEMVTGRVPFEGDTAFTIGMKHKAEHPAAPQKLNPQVPSKINNLIMKCLEKNKEDRWQSAFQILAELIRLEKDIVPSKEIDPEKKPDTIVTGGMDLKNSIAVLPFTNMSADPEQEYFCDGLAEEIINALSHIKELKVVARTSAFSFKGKDVDIEKIGKKLKVDKVLEGSVRKAGNRLRITAQLINVDDGYHLWSERYDRHLDDVFAIQDEVTLAIVDRMKVKILGEEKRLLTKRSTDNTEAYQLYLKGRYFANKRSPEGYRKAMEFYNKAIQVDPEFALSYTGLAYLYSILGIYGLRRPKDVFPIAESLNEKAFGIDEDLSSIHRIKGSISLFYDWDWPSSERSYRKAIELNPGDEYSHYNYALYLSYMGRSEEAIREMKKAWNLDPLSVVINCYMGHIYFCARRYDDAMQWYRKTLEIDPQYGLAFYFMGHLYASEKNYKESEKKFQEAVKLTGGLTWAVGWLSYVYSKQGKGEEAEKLMQELRKRSQKEYIPPLSFISVYLGLGKIDTAFEYLNYAYEERDPILCTLKVIPEVDPFRSDPRFDELLEKLNLK